ARSGRDCKIAIGSAGIKSIVREGRMEEAYQVRCASETAFEAYADFDKQQEHVALTNRSPGPSFLVLSEALEARSPLSEGLGNLSIGLHSESMPWKDKLPLALTAALRDNRQGRDDLDEVAAHIGPALSARVRFETGTSENLSNLMRRLAKHGPHADSEPCPMTFHYTQAAVPIAAAQSGPTVDLSTLLPIADGTLRALRCSEGVIRALDLDIARHLLLVTVPCHSWDDVHR